MKTIIFDNKNDNIYKNEVPVFILKIKIDKYRLIAQ